MPARPRPHPVGSRAQQADTRPVVLIVGASSGIGRATAQAFARRGVDLVLAARAARSLADVQRECEAEGSSVLVVPTDVSDAGAVDALFEAAVLVYGRVDIVVHSVAVVAYGRFDDLPADVFDQVIATTFTGTANVARAALRQFGTQGAGHLVVVGSLLGKIATPLMSAYVAAKWAVHGLTRVLQIEARQTPEVEVSLIWPGSVDTPAYTQAANFVGRIARPPPPVDSPEKVARAIVRAVAKPPREASVGVANRLIVTGFRLLPGVYDRAVGPLLRLAGLTRQSIGPTEGNVFEPNASGNAVRGNWKHHSETTDAKTKEPDMEASIPDDAPEVVRDINAGAEEVWTVLSDGWAYASWVVGTARIRGVDPDWPQPGAAIHHSFGLWPALIDDSTEVLSAQPLRELLLKARGWPAGEAHVRVVLTEVGTDCTRVRLAEDAVAGPGQLIPRPLRQSLIAWRNTESLRRLAYLAEHGNPSRRSAPD